MFYTFICIGPDKYGKEICNPAIGDKVLCPIQDVVVPFFCCGGDQGSCIAARNGFGEGIGSDPLSPSKFGEIFFLLFFGSIFEKRRLNEGVVHRHGNAARSASPVNFHLN